MQYVRETLMRRFGAVLVHIEDDIEQFHIGQFVVHMVEIPGRDSAYITVGTAAEGLDGRQCGGLLLDIAGTAGLALASREQDETGASGVLMARAR